jgi:hypothetical protein
MQEQNPEAPAPGPTPKPRSLKTKTKKILAVLRGLAKGSSIAFACKHADIGTTTFWNIRQKNARIEALAKRLIESRIQTVEDSLFQACIDKNVTAIIFFLTNRAGDRWADRRALVNNTNVFNAKGEAAKNGQDDTAESIFKRIDSYRQDIIPPTDAG